jgi:hypothetical protein
MVKPERQQLNQQMFRAANERLEDAVDGQIPAETLIPFFCECADETCRGRINLDASDYDGIHVDRELYIVLRGHPTMAAEETVEQNSHYSVLRKPA